MICIELLRAGPLGTIIVICPERHINLNHPLSLHLGVNSQLDHSATTTGFKDEDLFFEVLLLIFSVEKDAQLQNQQF